MRKHLFKASHFSDGQFTIFINNVWFWILNIQRNINANQLIVGGEIMAELGLLENRKYTQEEYNEKVGYNIVNYYNKIKENLLII